MEQPSQEYPPWLTPVPSVVTDAAGFPVATVTGVSYIAPTYYGPSVSVNDGNGHCYAKMINRYRWEHSTVMVDPVILRRSSGLRLALLQEPQLHWPQPECLARLRQRRPPRSLQEVPSQLQLL